MSKDRSLTEHNLVQTYYRILDELKGTAKEGEPEITSTAVATLAAAADIHDQLEYHGDAIKAELAGISDIIGKE